MIKKRRTIKKNSAYALFQEDISVENFDSKLGIALNGYQRNYNFKDSKNFLIEFRPEIKREVESLTEKQFYNYISLGYTCKFLLDNNLDQFYHQETGEWINKKIDELLQLKKEKRENVVETGKKHDVQLAILNQIREKMGEIDNYFSDFVYGNSTNFNMIEYLKGCNFSAVHFRKIYNHYNKEKEEFSIALNCTTINKYNKDGLIGEGSHESDIKEGYSWLSDFKLKKIISFYEDNLKDLDNYIKLNSTARTRKPKKLSVQKIISKVKYLKESKEYGITSLTPDKLIGASMAVMFNEKTRKLSIFHAADRKGLQIKGTAVFNFDEESSSMKTVRSYVNIQELAQHTKTGIKKAYEELTTKSGPCNNRINSDTIIIKVF